MSATCIAGRPQEFFAPDFVGMWRRRWCLDDSAGPRAYVDAALRNATSRNGVAAFKIQWMHVGPLASSLGLGNENVLSALLPGAAYVNTVRRDRTAQALSWFRAIETREWARLGESPAPPPAPPPLDPDAVMKLEAHIAWQQSAWNDYFAAAGIVPLTVEYESLDCDYRGEVGRVLDFLGLDPSAATALPPPRLARQADGVTARWRRRLDAPRDAESR